MENNLKVKDTIKRLAHQVRGLIDSPRNQEKRALWQPQSEFMADDFRAIPRPLKEIGKIPLIVDVSWGILSRIFDFSQKEYFHNPELYLETWLKGKLFHFNTVKDDIAIEPKVFLYFSIPFELSFFGARGIYTDDAPPWPQKEPVIKGEKDLAKLEYPDFFKSGQMPLAHKFYTEMSTSLKNEGILVNFVDWYRGPWGNFCGLRGFNEAHMDVYDNPEFVHRTMRFLTDSRKRWLLERAKFLGEKTLPKTLLYDDEVSFLSPAQYKEFVFPYEKELCEYQNGVVYWHSCGDITHLLPFIREIPKISILNVSSWTNAKEAIKVFGSDTPLEICFHPIEDMLGATPEKMEIKIREKLKICKELEPLAWNFRVEAVQGEKTPQEDIEHIQTWMKIARKLTEDMVKS